MSESTNIIIHPADQQLEQSSAQQAGPQPSLEYASGPGGPKFRYCYSAVVRCVSKQQLDTLPEATAGVGQNTTSARVTQGDNPKFELYLQTRTCFGSRSYGSFPSQHAGRCIALDEENEEVVVAHIQLVFYMEVDSPRTFTGASNHPLNIKTNDIRNQMSNRLPTLPEAEDLENAEEMMKWSRDFPETRIQGGLVPYVKGVLGQMVRGYAFPETLPKADGPTSWFEVQESFNESIQPLDDNLVTNALVGALAQVRKDCRVYEMVKWNFQA